MSRLSRSLLQCLGVLGLWACVASAVALDPDKAFHHYVMDKWGTQAGLPQTSVLCITQDRTGYLWVGTQNGLARFDGVRFTSHTQDDTPGLPGTWIRALLTDRKGRMWIGTYKGLAVREHGRIRPVPAADARLPTLDVFALAETADGDVLAATSEGVFRVSGDRLVALPYSPRPAFSLLARRDGVWVGTLGAVERLAGTGRARMPLPKPAQAAAVSQLTDAQGRLWAGTTQGLFTLNANGWAAVVAHPALANSVILALGSDSDQNLWIVTNSGLLRFRNAALAEFVPETHPRGFPQVAAIYEDRERNLWLGSLPDGLARLWNGWTRRFGTTDGLHNPVVWSVSRAPDGRLWVGTNDGLTLFEQNRLRLVVPGTALPHPHAYNLLAEADRVWIGTRRGVAVWEKGQLRSLPELAPMATAQINGIVRDRDGALWFPTSEGLFRVVDGRVHRYAQEQGLRDPRVRTMAFLRDGRILLGTQSGLFELRDGHARRIEMGPGPSAEVDITSVRELRDGRIVIGSLGEHLAVLAGGRWHWLGARDGLPANPATFLAEDPSGVLWIAGLRGVTRIALDALPMTAAEPRRPLPGEMVLSERGLPNAGQAGLCCNGVGMSKGLRDADGVLWLPSRDGLVSLDTRAIVTNPVPPSVVVERVRSRHGWHMAPADSPRLELPADSRDLEFEFTALSFQDPRSLQLRYRLHGYDATWQHLDDMTRRTARYTNLPPGRYAFQVIGANNAGVWSQAPATLRLHIAPRFHETRLFQLLAAALLIVVFYAIYRRQQRLHARSQLRLETEVRVRTQELHVANERLESASQTDPVTGLRNRRYLANQLPADIAYFDREQQRTGDYEQVIVFAQVSIDRFSQVTEQHGARTADQVLHQVAQLLTSIVRSGDYLLRWGGGQEFLFVFRPMRSGHLQILGERIRATVSAFPFDVGAPQPLRLTCSTGLAEYPLFRDSRHDLGWEQVVELADAAVYWVKRHGRDGWAALRPTAGTGLATLMPELRQDVDAVLASGRLQLLWSGSEGEA